MNSYLTTQQNFANKSLFHSQIFRCVAYITHKCPTLQELFLKWSNLSKKEKILLNYMTYFIMEKKQMELYSPIIQGFNYWNTIQDIEGACGFHDNPLDFKLGSDDEKDILQLTLLIDQLVTNILMRPSLCEEIKKKINHSKTFNSNDISGYRL